METTPPAAIAGVILATGLSRRMSGFKPLLPFRGTPLLAQVLAGAGSSRLAPCASFWITGWRWTMPPF